MRALINDHPTKDAAMAGHDRLRKAYIATATSGVTIAVLASPLPAFAMHAR